MRDLPIRRSAYRTLSRGVGYLAKRDHASATYFSRGDERSNVRRQPGSYSEARRSCQMREELSNPGIRRYDCRSRRRLTSSFRSWLCRENRQKLVRTGRRQNLDLHRRQLSNQMRRRLHCSKWLRMPRHRRQGSERTAGKRLAPPLVPLWFSDRSGRQLLISAFGASEPEPILLSPLVPFV